MSQRFSCNNMLTRRLVVADGEVRRHIAANVGETGRAAVIRGTSNLAGRLPDNLRKVSPVLEVGHIRAGLSVQIAVVVDFAVVEEVRDDGANLPALNTSSNVLAIASTIGSATIRLVDDIKDQILADTYTLCS